ncbi:MAG TPA: hypothetical protein VJY62_14770 [Bacteroidia bacterium]|nr:hypothetical protein [Bacteroidia bacterium]
MELLTLTDFILLPFVLFFIYYFARMRRDDNIEKYPEYKYYIAGLNVKIIGAISITLIYLLYYGGGDTTNYYHDAICWNKLMFSNPEGFFTVLKEGTNINNYFYFTPETGYPIYWKDRGTTFVVRLAFFVTLLSFRSFLVATILFAWFSYMGVWRLFRVFLYEFPMLSREMSIAFLFIPSVFFWGSGMLKDTVTFSAAGFFTFNFYRLFIKRKQIFYHAFGLLASSYVILAIKPYIIFAFLPGCLLWIINNIITRFGGSFTRAVATPVFLVIAFTTGYFLLNNLSSQLGDYSLEKVLDKAVLTQTDLKSDYYHGNAFDLGDLEATIPSMLSKAHLAINAALFRPYLWECKNPVMFLSGIENFIILSFTLLITLRLKIIGVFKYFIKHHLLTFSLVFSLFFAFSVGISTPNFGSMVRYRIPILPFYVASLFIIRHYYKLETAQRKYFVDVDLGNVKPADNLSLPSQ